MTSLSTTAAYRHYCVCECDIVTFYYALRRFTTLLHILHCQSVAIFDLKVPNYRQPTDYWVVSTTMWEVWVHAIALGCWHLVNRNVTSCVAAGCGRHGIPPPACKNPTSQLGVTVDSACSTDVPIRKSSHSVDMIQFRGLSSNLPGDGACLRYGPSYSVFSLDTAAHYCPWGVQLFYQFWCF